MKGIPTYSLASFKRDASIIPYQVEIFDANRHFEVQYPHYHDFFEILFLLKGSGVHIIDNNQYPIEPPCIFFLSPGQAHKLKLSQDVGGYIFLFTGEFYLLDKSNKNKLLEYPFFFNVKQENPPLLIQQASDVNFLETLFLRACEVMKYSKPDSEEQQHALLDLILCTCQSLYPQEQLEGERRKTHVLVKRFRELIEEKYHSNLSIKEYASLLGVTENYLTLAVKECTSKTSKELIIEKQIIEIKRLLRYTDLSIKEMVDRLNFKDQSYFSKFFKRETGTSPIDYRLKSLKNT